jgi:SAM-dependent methyltransferase
MAPRCPHTDFAAVAPEYDRHRRPAPEQVAAWGAELARGTRPGAGVFLDVGCGTGTYTEGVAAAFAGPVVGLDPCREMLAQGAPKVPRAGWVQAEAEHLPVRDGALAGVSLVMVCHHLRERVETFRELRRALAPGGTLAVLTRSHDEIRGSALALFPGVLDIDLPRFPDTPALVGELAAAGFADVAVAHIAGSRWPKDRERFIEQVRHRFVTTLRAWDGADFDARFAAFERAVRERFGPTFEDQPFTLVRARKPA